MTYAAAGVRYHEGLSAACALTGAWWPDDRGSAAMDGWLAVAERILQGCLAHGSAEPPGDVARLGPLAAEPCLPVPASAEGELIDAHACCACRAQHGLRAACPRGKQPVIDEYTVCHGRLMPATGGGREKNGKDLT